MTNQVIPAEAVEAAAKVIYSDGWDGAPYWESMADDNSDKVHHRAIAQHALEAAAPYMLTEREQTRRDADFMAAQDALSDEPPTTPKDLEFMEGRRDDKPF